jgi:AcrR family transcriptional regulator
MRADARRNRERIVAAALDRFAACGPDVAMDDIARAAGLGVGTLYRHFSDRQALATEIAADALVELVAVTRAASASEATGWESFRDVTQHSTGLPLALVKTLSAQLPPSDRIEALRAESNELLAEIVARGQRDGSIRADLATPDILDLFSVVVCRAGAQPGDSVTTVMLDGLRPRHAPEPGQQHTAAAGRHLV